MNIEGPGDLADGPSLADQLADELLLIWPHFWRPAKGDAALATPKFETVSAVQKITILALTPGTAHRQCRCPFRTEP